MKLNPEGALHACCGPESVKLDASKMKANKLVLNDIDVTKAFEYQLDSQLNSMLESVAKDANTIRMEVTETTDRFIFQTIQPFCNDIAGFDVSKTELVEAIQLLRLKKVALDKYRIVLDNDITSATYISAQCEKAYQSGYEDGVKEVKEKIKETNFMPGRW